MLNASHLFSLLMTNSGFSSGNVYCVLNAYDVSELTFFLGVMGGGREGGGCNVLFTIVTHSQLTAMLL